MKPIEVSKALVDLFSDGELTKDQAEALRVVQNMLFNVNRTAENRNLENARRWLHDRMD